MGRRQCRFCGSLFPPDPRLKGRQSACSAPDCQRERHRLNCAAWNELHRDQHRGRYPETRAWLDRHPAYLADYRREHPEAAERHRTAERERLRRRRRAWLDIQDSILVQVLARPSCRRRTSPTTTASWAPERRSEMSSSEPKREKRLMENLEFLGLKKIAEIHRERAKAAEKEALSYGDFLDRLVAEEAAAKFERLVRNRIAQARFPTIKTLDSFDFTHPKKIDRAQIERLFTLGFVEERANCIFIANHGLGKTHLSLALGYEACLRGISTRFVTAIDAIHELTAATADGSFVTALKRFTRPRVLVVDELGYLPVSRGGVELLFQIISTRYETGSIILTTNRPFKQWGKLFGNDNTLAAAVVDRLVHHAEIVVIEGDSYRMKRD